MPIELDEPDFHMRKHSILIDGHSTSITLEDAFWTRLVDIAERRGISINKLIAEVDHGRVTNLSSALRVFILKDLTAQGED